MSLNVQKPDARAYCPTSPNLPSSLVVTMLSQKLVSRSTIIATGVPIIPGTKAAAGDALGLVKTPGL